MHCYLGLDGIAPENFRKICRQQLSRYETVTVVDEMVTAAEPLPMGFAVQAAGVTYHCSKLLIASGVEDQLPDISDIERFFGVSVHVCPYCDGWEHRDAPVAVYGAGNKGAELALMLRRWTRDLLLCTDAEIPSPELRKKLQEHDIAIEESRVLALEGHNGCLERIRFDNGKTMDRRALFFSTSQHPRSRLLAGLGCNHTPERGTLCDDDGMMSVAGVDAAGDASRERSTCYFGCVRGRESRTSYQQSAHDSGRLDVANDTLQMTTLARCSTFGRRPPPGKFLLQLLELLVGAMVQVD